MSTTEEQLHSADIESIARRLVELACAETQTRHGAVFLWDAKLKGLTVDFHVVEGVIVAPAWPGAVLKPRRDGRPNGIALTCFERGQAVPVQRHRARPALRALLPRRGVDRGRADPLAAAADRRAHVSARAAATRSTRRRSRR